MNMRAFVITERFGECGGVLVFAESITQAKKLGLAGLSDWESLEWCDLRCRREPRADHLAERYAGKVLCAWNEEQCRIYRELGWHELEGGGACVECGFYQWEPVPESHLDEWDVCAECRKEQP